MNKIRVKVTNMPTETFESRFSTNSGGETVKVRKQRKMRHCEATIDYMIEDYNLRQRRRQARPTEISHSMYNWHDSALKDNGSLPLNTNKHSTSFETRAVPTVTTRTYNYRDQYVAPTPPPPAPPPRERGFFEKLVDFVYSLWS